MPLTFACPCGKQLQTASENAGKRVKCPSCGQILMIPAATAATNSRPAAPTRTPTPPPFSAVRAPALGVVHFFCECGKQLQAKTELAGKRVKCPGCGAD